MASVLVIDDDDQIRELLEMYLKADGHYVILASSGSEGIVLFDQNRFDLVITDVVMPNGGGIEVIMHIHRTGEGTPIIAISGGALRQEEHFFNLSAAAAFGVTQTLAKPFSEEQLRATIAKVLC